MKETKEQKIKKDILSVAEHYLKKESSKKWRINHCNKFKLQPAKIELKALSVHLTNIFSEAELVNFFYRYYQLPINKNHLITLKKQNFNYIFHLLNKPLLKYYPFVFINVHQIKNNVASSCHYKYVGLVFAINSLGEFQILDYQFLLHDSLEMYYDSILLHLQKRGVTYIEVLYLSDPIKVIDQHKQIYKFHFSNTLHYFFELRNNGNFTYGMKKYYQSFQKILLKQNFELAAYAFEDILNEIILDLNEYDTLSYQFLKNLLIFYQLPHKTRLMLVTHNFMNLFWQNWLKEWTSFKFQAKPTFKQYHDLFKVYLQKMNYDLQNKKINHFHEVYNELKDLDLFDDFDDS